MAGEGEMGLWPEFIWERRMMINLGLNGDVPILDYDAVGGQSGDGIMILYGTSQFWIMMK